MPLLVGTLTRVAFGGAVLAWTTSGSAAPSAASEERACTSARQAALEQVQSSHLRAAKESFMSCSRRACSGAVRRECTAGFNQLDTMDIPSLLPSVSDEAGRPLTDVQVTMDGEVLASRLDGQPIAVDPGLHEFSFATKGQIFATPKLMIVQGQQSRPIAVVFHSPDVAAKASPETPASPAAPESAPPPREPGRRNGMPLLLAGVGIACAEAAALGVLFSKEGTLSTAADVSIGISLGVSSAALLATIWVFTSPGPADQKAAETSGVRLAVRPVHSGVVAAITASF